MNADKLAELLEEIILDVELEIITYIAAGRILEERFSTLFWSPCATHCIDLLVEDIGKLSWMMDVVQKARNITNYIYNHTWVLQLMR